MLPKTSLVVAVALSLVSIPNPAATVSEWLGGTVNQVTHEVHLRKSPNKAVLQTELVSWYLQKGYRVVPDNDPPQDIEFSLEISTSDGLLRGVLVCTKKTPRTLHFEFV